MTDLSKDLIEKGYKIASDLTPWEKTYWYLRILVNTDRFGSLSNKPVILESLSTNLLTTYQKLLSSKDDDKTKSEILNSVLKQVISKNTNPKTKFALSADNLLTRLAIFLTSPEDYYVFAVTIKDLLIPTNSAVLKVPSTEVTDFARIYAKAILDVKKEHGLATLLLEWDSFTEDLSLNKEREIIVELYKNIKSKLPAVIKTANKESDEGQLDLVLTAVCQEYERRVGQKRKQRAGSDLEGATEFIFHYFGIPTHGAPEHFTAGIEVDNWLKDKNGWYIAISLKRTLRERWKQTYTTEVGMMDRHHIKNLVHLICNDMDLSDTKIAELGSYNHLFALPDDSPVLNKYKNHSSLGKYIFPMSSLITVVNKLIKG